jgi:hypothetical protein
MNIREELENNTRKKENMIDRVGEFCLLHTLSVESSPVLRRRSRALTDIRQAQGNHFRSAHSQYKYSKEVNFSDYFLKSDLRGKYDKYVFL